MNQRLTLISLRGMLALAGMFTAASAQTPDAAPYKVLNVAKVGGAGGFDYVYADADERRLYIPRGDRITVFDLDSLSSVGVIPNTASVHGVAVDPKSHHGFSSSNPLVMWDSRTLAPIKTIAAQGSPDGILFDVATERVFVLSHRPPNLTVIDARDGSIAGTVDLGGAPEQGASDGQGQLYFDVEDKDQIAVVAAKTLKVSARYELGGKGGGPAGLAPDAKHHILFVLCRNPATCVILNAHNGRIITTLPIGAGTDGGAFNPNTMEAFSSQGDGTLTVIKENAPDNFAVEQTVRTQLGAKTCTLDSKTNRILLITAEFGPVSAAAPSSPGPGSRRPRRGPMVPDSFTVLAVGR